MSKPQLRAYRFKAMGSPCEIMAYCSSERVFQLAINEIDRLEVKYSRFRNDSVTTRINRNSSRRPIALDDETLQLLHYADEAYKVSDGLFDITSGVLRRAWDFKSGRIPTEQELSKALACIGWDKVVWQTGEISLRDGMEIDFGGYVKEYAADKAARVLLDNGIRSGVVDLGGDIVVLGPHPSGKPWKIGVRNPRSPESAIAYIQVTRGAVATSGDYERYMVVDNVRYCHILNPKTGMPATDLASVSVLTDDCIVAGSLATITMLKGLDGISWLAQQGVEHYCISQDSDCISSGVLPSHRQVAL